jgi:hypothetical protein
MRLAKAEWRSTCLHEQVSQPLATIGVRQNSTGVRASIPAAEHRTLEILVATQGASTEISPESDPLVPGSEQHAVLSMSDFRPTIVVSGPLTFSLTDWK